MSKSCCSPLEPRTCPNQSCWHQPLLCFWYVKVFDHIHALLLLIYHSEWLFPNSLKTHPGHCPPLEPRIASQDSSCRHSLLFLFPCLQKRLTAPCLPCTVPVADHLSKPHWFFYLFVGQFHFFNPTNSMCCWLWYLPQIPWSFSSMQQDYKIFTEIAF